MTLDLKLWGSILTLACVVGCDGNKPQATPAPAPATTLSATAVPTSNDSATSGTARARKVAQNAMDSLGRGDFAGVHAQFDAPMKSTLSQAQLESTWKRLKGYGDYRGWENVRSEKVGETEVVLLDAKFKFGIPVIQFTINPDGTIGGFFIRLRG